MKQEIMKVMTLVAEMQIEACKSTFPPARYDKNGKQIYRQDYEEIKTERYNKLFYGDGGIRDVKVFKCKCCGKMVDYFQLETMCCDFYNDDYLCAQCYDN